MKTKLTARKRKPARGINLGKGYKVRSLLIFLGLLIPIVFILYKLASLQIFQHQTLLQRGNSQHKLHLKIEPKRGDIYDRKQRILATNIDVKSIYGIPYEIENPEETAVKLSAIVGVSQKKIARRLASSKKFVWIKRRVSDSVYNQVNTLNLKGIDFLEESQRFYPKDELLSHILGFVNIDNKGLEGIELSLDKYLKGEPGFRFVERDASGRAIMSLVKKEVPPQNGKDVILTIDEVIQYIAETELEKVYKKYNALGATIIVMDPLSGEILALANRPTYNPNQFYNYDSEHIRNRALTDFFEPGSTFKVLVAAAALNEQIVSLEEEFFCEHGVYRVGRRTLHDAHPYANLTFRQVIEKSSNIGISKVASRLGKDKLYSYISKFGFGKSTELGLSGEARGMLSHFKRWSKIQTANVSMGQGVSVTAIQLINAISAVANQGGLLNPRVVKSIINDDGSIFMEDKVGVVRQVISPQVALMLVDIMEGVVSLKGTARRAAIEGFSVAGKTGTAQKVKSTGGYSHSDFVASFIGFVPSHDPVVSILVVLDNPKPIYYGGVVAAPVFREVAKAVLKYLGVSPDNPKPSAEKLV